MHYANGILTRILSLPLSRALSLFVMTAVVFLSPITATTAREVVPRPDPEDVIKLMVPKEPLKLPDDFIKVLNTMNISAIALIGSEGQISGYFVDGRPIDLCDRLVPKKQREDRIYHGTSTSGVSCEAAPTGGTLLRALSSQADNNCSICTGRDGYDHRCNRSSNRWSCANKRKRCAASSPCD